MMKALKAPLVVVFATGLLLAALVLALTAPARGAATFPDGFVRSPVVSGLVAPNDIEFAPDGRLFVAQQEGNLRVFDEDEGTLTTFLNITAKVNSNGSNGLLGVTFDPNYDENRFIYLFYTHVATDTVPLHNRIVRVTANQDGTGVVPGSEQLLLQLDELEDTGFHNGGSLDFGGDGKLYASVGENNQRSVAQRLDNFFGKMVRINKDGTIPPNNPFYDDASGDKRAIWALGLRNPYKIAVQPGTGTIFINDVGSTGDTGEDKAREEVNEGIAGANYGWPLVEGEVNDPRFTDPVVAFAHGTTNQTGCSITGGTFYNPREEQFPNAYVGDYFYAEFCNGWIRRYDPATDRSFRFATGVVKPIDLEVSEDGSLHVLDRNVDGNRTGSVTEIQFTGNANRRPTAVLEADPTSGLLDLEVGFDGSGSSDPDPGDTLTYVWDFGDGETKTTTDPTTSHTYRTEGTYTASLRVRDDQGEESDPATVRIFAGNEAPDPVIDLPSGGLLFRVDQRITLSGSATDPEDGTLGDASLEWEVLRHHNASHTHPYFFGTGNDLTFTAPPPEDFDSTGAGNFLEIRLTATDSEGLSETVTRNIQPNRVDLTFETNPRGLSLEVEDQPFVAPETFRSWEGYELSISATSPQKLSGTTYVFSSWSDGGQKKHDISTEARPATYTATYVPCTIRGTAGDDVLDGTPGADTICGISGNDTIKGMGGNDTIEGMGGNDELRGDGGADLVRGGTGADDLYGNDGDDTLDSKDGTSGNDSLDGGPGTDTSVTDPTEESIVGFP